MTRPAKPLGAAYGPRHLANAMKLAQGAQRIASHHDLVYTGANRMLGSVCTQTEIDCTGGLPEAPSYGLDKLRVHSEMGSGECCKTA